MNFRFAVTSVTRVTYTDSLGCRVHTITLTNKCDWFAPPQLGVAFHYSIVERSGFRIVAKRIWLSIVYRYVGFDTENLRFVASAKIDENIVKH
jgi:hypothetical protein